MAIDVLNKSKWVVNRKTQAEQWFAMSVYIQNHGIGDQKCGIIGVSSVYAFILESHILYVNQYFFLKGVNAQAAHWDINIYFLSK